MTGLIVGTVALAGGCDPTGSTGADVDPPNLKIAGYTTVDALPAPGVVALYDSTGTALASTRAVQGRYAISRPFDPGTFVCGLIVRAWVEDEIGTREASTELASSTGACVVPSDASIEHWVPFDMPYRLTDPGG